MAEAVRRDYQAYYEQHALDTSRPYPGIPELLHTLSAQGLKLCIFSNKPHADTCHVVAHFFPEISFTEVRGQVEGTPVKPDPAGALAIANSLRLAPSAFLYLGDTATDMRCAVRAGMHPAGVLWGFREADELWAAGAEQVIAQPEEALQLIRSKPLSA